MHEKIGLLRNTVAGMEVNLDQKEQNICLRKLAGWELNRRLRKGHRNWRYWLPMCGLIQMMTAMGKMG